MAFYFSPPIMHKTIFITGGQRSGKSSYAQNTALKLSPKPVYMATARCWDEDFGKRIERHKQDRNSQWENIEEEKNLSRHNLRGKVVLIDCITLWLTNFFTDTNSDIDQSLALAKQEWEKIQQTDATFIVVSNELGMSLHSENENGRKFTDLQGWMNQHIANHADEVFLMISGIPIKIK